MSELSSVEYQVILRRDLMAFTQRSFYELNPQTRFYESPHIEVMASKLEECRLGMIKRLIVNMPALAEVSCGECCLRGLASGPQSGYAGYLCQLWSGVVGKACPRLPHSDVEHLLSEAISEDQALSGKAIR